MQKFFKNLLSIFLKSKWNFFLGSILFLSLILLNQLGMAEQKISNSGNGAAQAPADIPQPSDVVPQNSQTLPTPNSVNKNAVPQNNEQGVLNQAAREPNSKVPKELGVDQNGLPLKSILPKEGTATSQIYKEQKDNYLKPSPTEEGYIYDPVGRRDPFKPYRNAKIGVGSLTGYIKNRDIEPLEKFDAKSLQVIAIIWGTNKPKALLEDPDHNIHTVFKGMRIGKNDGVVAEIREGEIVIVEVFDYNGKLTKDSVVLPIRK